MTDLLKRFHKISAWAGLALLIPGIYLMLPSFESAFFPVVKVLHIEARREIVNGTNYISVQGLIDKRRPSCKIEDLYAMGGNPLRMLTLERGDSGGYGHLVNRPAGVQEIGPWRVQMPREKTTMAIYAQHTCTMPWRIQTILFYAAEI